WTTVLPIRSCQESSTRFARISAARYGMVSRNPAPSPSTISTVSWSSARKVRRGVNAGKRMTSVCPSGNESGWAKRGSITVWRRWGAAARRQGGAQTGWPFPGSLPSLLGDGFRATSDAAARLAALRRGGRAHLLGGGRAGRAGPHLGTPAQPAPGVHPDGAGGGLVGWARPRRRLGRPLHAGARLLLDGRRARVGRGERRRAGAVLGHRRGALGDGRVAAPRTNARRGRRSLARARDGDRGPRPAQSAGRHRDERRGAAAKSRRRR